jgi:hypothetical protein
VLSGNVLLDGAAAIALNQRDFATWIGVKAQPWSKEKITYEIWNNRRIYAKGADFADLGEKQAQCEVLSQLFHAPYELNTKTEELTPGALLWKNEAGGIIITLAINITDFNNGFTAFCMLCETRKSQLTSFLSQLDGLPFYIPGDAEVMLNVGKLNDGSYLVAGLNIGLDALTTVPLAGTVLTETSRVEILTPEGVWKQPDIFHEHDTTTLDLHVPACTPFVLRITSTCCA